MDVNEYLKSIENVVIDDTIDMRIFPRIRIRNPEEDFVDCIENLLKHPKFLSSRIIPSSVEEQQIIERGGKVFEKFVHSLIDEIRDF